MKKGLLLIVMSLFLVSCGINQNTVKHQKAQKIKLENTSWKSIESVKGKVPTLQISNGKIHGNAGCNNYFGSLTINKATGLFSVGKLGVTKMACRNMKVEQNFLQMLQKVDHYKIEEGILKLYHNKILILKFAQE
ncbi:MAG: heat-shock protein HslJ [Flavobacteriales bacterium]|nr:MAG: heat-shock protein HslJ [Flavobacteriales bacterium]